MDLNRLHKACAAIFMAKMFESARGGPLGVSNACKVYDALVGDCFDRQDCIGENFNQMLHRVAEEWFGNYRPGRNADYYFCTYILQLYLFVERVDLIFHVINSDGKSKIFRDYHEKNFSTLRRINKWANFFKHPKEFLFTHWPRYYFASEKPQISEGDVIINYEFIKKHYFSEKNPSPTILENNNKVFVDIPDLEEMTGRFCDEMNVFFDFICNNQLVADFLKRRSTIALIYEPNEGGESPPDEGPVDRRQ